VILFTALTVCLVASGDPASAKTVYSLNGLGDPVRRVDVRSLGMGGAGSALADGRNFGLVNPALLGSFSGPAMNSRYTVQRRSLKDDGGQSHVLSDGDVGALQVVIPAWRRTVLGFGIEPLTDMDFAVTDSIATAPLPYRLGIDATGGMQSFTVAAGHAVGQFYVGARLDLIVLGTISEVWTREFGSEETGDLDGRSVIEALDTSDRFVRTFQGAVPAVGGIYRPNEGWYVGLALQAGRKITQKETLYNFFAQRGFSEGIESESKIELPSSFAVGVAYVPGPRWEAALDITGAFWGDTAPGRHNTLMVAGGGLYRTGSDDPLARRRRFELTGGLHYRSLYFSMPGGEQVGEMGISFGVTFPLKKGGGGWFSYAIELGSRGDTEAHGLSERYIMQTFSLSGFLR
jgi:hypothetical protein